MPFERQQSSYENLSLPTYPFALLITCNSSSSYLPPKVKGEKRLRRVGQDNHRSQPRRSVLTLIHLPPPKI